MGHTPTIERCIDWATVHEEADFHQTEALQAELQELRRKAWNWDEARRLVAQSKHQSMIAYEVKTFVAGDGDAEWERKASAKMG